MPHALPAKPQRPRVFGWLNGELAIVLVAQVVTVTLAYARLGSDVRDESTRLEQNIREVDELRTSREHDREEYGRLLRELNAKVEVLLERTAPK